MRMLLVEAVPVAGVSCLSVCAVEREGLVCEGWGGSLGGGDPSWSGLTAHSNRTALHGAKR